MPVICKLPGGSGSGGGSDDGLKLNIFTQPTEPETKDGIWIQKNNTHKNIVVDNLISNDGEWSDVVTDTCPIESSRYSNNHVVYNDSIVVSGDSGLWSFDGSTWTKIAEKPTIGRSHLVVLDGKLIALDGDGSAYDEYGISSNGFCVLNGTTWTNVKQLSFSLSDVIPVAYNGYIYVITINLDANPQRSELWKISNSGSCTRIQNMSWCHTSEGLAVVYNNKIYWSFEEYWHTDDYVQHYHPMITSSGGNVTCTENALPFLNSNDYIIGSDVYNNEIHVLVYNGDEKNYKHYKYDGSTWTYLFNLGSYSDLGDMDYSEFITWNTTMYWFTNHGNSSLRKYTKTHSKYDPHTMIIQANDTFNGSYATALVDTSSAITGANSRFVTRFDDVFFVGESGMDTEDPIYYGDGTKWVKFKN